MALPACIVIPQLGYQVPGARAGVSQLGGVSPYAKEPSSFTMAPRLVTLNCMSSQAIYTENLTVPIGAATYFRTSWRSATMPLSYAFTSTRCRATSLSSPSKNGIPSPSTMGMIE